MTPDILLTLLILLGAVILFITEWLRVDLVALLVLVSLALTGLVTPEEAVSGFSNPAVITVWAVFILSAGLTTTGVADKVGRQMLRLGAKGEARILIVIMLTAAVLSAFMNNVGVAAMLLPVVLVIARKTGIARSKMLIPLAYGSLLGGLTTLIGTPVNILASNSLVAFGFPPLQLFDFAPVGLIAMLTGIAFVVLLGRRLLPEKDIARDLAREEGKDLTQLYHLQEQLWVLSIPPASILDGKTLAASRIGSALGLNVIGIIRNGKTQLAPDQATVFKSGDHILVTGNPDRVTEFHNRQYLITEEKHLNLEDLFSPGVDMIEVTLTDSFPHLGQTLQQANFRQRYSGVVLAIWRDGQPIRTEMDNLPLRAEDILLLQISHNQLEAYQKNPGFRISSPEEAQVYRLEERLLMVSIPPDSTLVGKSLAESRLAHGLGLTVLGIARNGKTRLIVPPEEIFQAGDRLLLKGKPENLAALKGLQGLEIVPPKTPDLKIFESEEVGLVEVALSPHGRLAGKTLRQLHFREKFGLSVLAIWREGQAYLTDLQDLALRFGDGLLLYGPREKLTLLISEVDFLVLTGETAEPVRSRKAPLAALIMTAVVISVITGWLTITIATVVGATLMLLTGCLKMDEAYHYIDWRAVFLIAGMLPLGIAMGTSGAAQFVADQIVSAVGGASPRTLLAGLFLLTSVGSQFMPNSVVMVLMAPIAINAALNQTLSPYPLIITVALAASASFFSPVGHPANILVMGPGGYRFSDYIKIGLPLTVLILVITVLVVPFVWPLNP